MAKKKEKLTVANKCYRLYMYFRKNDTLVHDSSPIIINFQSMQELIGEIEKHKFDMIEIFEVEVARSKDNESKYLIDRLTTRFDYDRRFKMLYMRELKTSSMIRDAAFRGRLDDLKIMLEECETRSFQECDPNDVSLALEWACYNGQFEVVKYLLTKNPHIPDIALEMAYFYNYEDIIFEITKIKKPTVRCFQFQRMSSTLYSSEENMEYEF